MRLHLGECSFRLLKKNSCINFRYLFPQLYALWAIADGFDSHQYRDFKLCVCNLGQNAYLPTLIKYLYNYIINKRQELSTLYLFIYINIFIFFIQKCMVSLHWYFIYDVFRISCKYKQQFYQRLVMKFLNHQHITIYCVPPKRQAL